MERNHQQLASTVSDLTSDIRDLYYVVTEGRADTDKLDAAVKDMRVEINQMKTEIDRLEDYSRRENLRMFGIPHRNENEDNDTCLNAVIDTLNSLEGQKKTWTSDDITRAHRIGQSREGKPRPMIVRFMRWRDKMSIITNKELRDQLREKGINVANDMTRTQANMVAQARREGKKAYFSKGKMVIVPLPADDRSYAQVTKTGVTDNNTRSPMQEAGHNDTGLRNGQGQGETTNDGQSLPPPDLSAAATPSGQHQRLADEHTHPLRDDMSTLMRRHQHGTGSGGGGTLTRNVDDSRQCPRSTRGSSTGSRSRQGGLHSYFRHQTDRSPAAGSDSGSDRFLRNRRK